MPRRRETSGFGESIDTPPFPDSGGQAQSSYIGIKEIELMIPEFHGIEQGGKLIFASEWLDKIESLGKVYKWTFPQMLLYASLRVKGPAQNWLDASEGSICSWEAFKAELKNNFPQSLRESVVHEKLANRKRRYNETLEEYYHEVVRTAKRIRLGDDTIKEYLIKGLPGVNDRKVLRAVPQCSLPDFLRHMLKLEEDEDAEKSKMAENTASNYKGSDRSRSGGSGSRQWIGRRDKSEPKDGEKRKHQDSEQNRGKYSKETTTSRDQQIKEEKQKPAGDSEKRRCYKCKEIGHLRKDCPKRTNGKKDFHDRVVMGVLATREKNNTEPIKTAVIGESRLRAFIDLGSPRSLVRGKCAKNLNWENNGESQVLEGFGGSTITSLGSMELSVGLDDFVNTIVFLVVPDSVLPEDLLLGRDYFNTPFAQVIFEDSEIHVKDKRGKKVLKITQYQTLCLDDIKIDSSVDVSTQHRLLDLLNKYRKCMAVNIRELGQTDVVKMTLKLKSDEIVRYRPYRAAYSQRDQLKEIVDELLEDGVIEESQSEYASPTVLVTKKNGSHRLCVDYRKINSICQVEHFPLPNIEEEINKFAGKKWFCSLDMLSGFHQITVEESSRQYTAFITPDGHYQYRRMPFGLTNSPAVFMKLVSKVLKPVHGDGVSFYMDDILIGASDVSSLLSLLEDVLKELSKAGLTLNLGKCEFLSQNVSYLGHNISGEGITPGDLKTEAITKFETPKDQHSVRQFLGLTGYFRKFIPSYSIIAVPLYQLLKKNVKFVWSGEQQKAFKLLQEALTSRPVLALYSPECRHELHCDASSWGIGGILIQIDKENDARPIAYFSRTTSDAESRWASFELETLAVVESLKRFRYYLLGKHFVVVTDCKALEQAHGKRDMIPKFARWWLQIIEYDFDIVHRGNRKMKHVDCLSRNPVMRIKIMAILKYDDWLAAAQTRDSDLLEIRRVLEGSQAEHKRRKQIERDFELKDGLVFRVTKHGRKFYVPRGLRFHVVKCSHDRSGHLSVDRTVEELTKGYWFPKLRGFVRKYIESCISCARGKSGPDETRYLLHTVERKPIPFHTIHLDHSGPYPKGHGGNEYILVVTDSFTRFTILRAVKSANTSGVIRVLNEIFQYFGAPSTIVTDRGSAFTAKQFEEYCSERGIRLALVAAKTPRANGQAERVFKVVGDALRSMTKTDAGSDWVKNLPTVQWAINSLRNRVTGETPQKLLLGYKPRNAMSNTLLNLISDKLDEEVKEDIPLSELRERAKNRAEERQREQMSQFNEKRKAPWRYSEGDLVLIRWEPPATGLTRKMVPKYRGPYAIKRVLNADRYEVVDTEVTQLSQKPFSGVYTAEKLKPWGNLQDVEDECFRMRDEEDDSNEEV